MRYCLLPTILLFCLSLPQAGEPSGVVLPIDGYNTWHVGGATELRGEHLSLSGGAPHDSFYTISHSADDRLPLIHLQGQIGAETGDPLLNAFTDSRAFPNRDHRDYIGMEFRHPRYPFAVAVHSRYVDDYTDRFDALWQIFSDGNGKSMLHDREGVDDETAFLARWKGQRLDATVLVNPFGRWHATPYFFSPLCERGITIGEELRCTLSDRVTLTSHHRFIRSDWFYDYFNGKRFVDNVSENSLRYRVGADGWTSADVNYSSLVSPALRIGAGGGFTDTLFNFSAMLYGYGDGTVGGSACAAVTYNGVVRCSTAVAREYRCRERDYCFLQNDTVVSYRTAGAVRNTMFLDLQVQCGGTVPVSGESWIAYVSYPLWEALGYAGDTIFIRQTTEGAGVKSVAGINGRVGFRNRNVAAFVKPGVMLPLGSSDDIRLTCAFFADAEISFVSQGKNPLSASLTLHYNSAPQLVYPVTGPDGHTSKDIFTGDVCTVASLSIRMPFIFMPLQRLVHSTAFLLEAGPLPLGGESRVLIHPRGNRFGPEIYAGFEASVR